MATGSVGTTTPRTRDLFDSALKYLGGFQTESASRWNKLAQKAKAAGMDSESLAKLKFQHQLDAQQELVDMVSNLLKSLHEMAMSVIRNLRP